MTEERQRNLKQLIRSAVTVSDLWDRGRASVWLSISLTEGVASHVCRISKPDPSRLCVKFSLSPSSRLTKGKALVRHDCQNQIILAYGYKALRIRIEEVIESILAQTDPNYFDDIYSSNLEIDL